MAAQWAAIFLGMTGLLCGLRNLQQALIVVAYLSTLGISVVSTSSRLLR